MRRMLIAAAVLAFSAMSSLGGAARAVTPDEQLPDAKLEARARAVSEELRCVVCQNQSIDDSAAPLAHDLRVLLRERIAAGDTDEQAKAYLVQRYGTFVLLRPPIRPETWALWFGPLAALVVGGIGVAVYFRGRAGGPAALNDEDEAELDRLMATAHEGDD